MYLIRVYLLSGSTVLEGPWLPHIWEFSEAILDICFDSLDG
jgi:hypothetical protein